MRNNQPVTNNEYVLGDDALIVSKTDTKGKLTYFNQASSLKRRASAPRS